jgi:hypothetical protein
MRLVFEVLDWPPVPRLPATPASSAFSFYKPITYGYIEVDKKYFAQKLTSRNAICLLLRSGPVAQHLELQFELPNACCDLREMMNSINISRWNSAIVADSQAFSG